MTTLRPRAVGTPMERLDGPAKVTGTARYAFEQPVENPLYVHPLQSTIARGRVSAVDTEDAEACPGVACVLTHHDAPRLADTGDRELAVLQSGRVAFRGQFVGAVVAKTPETARHAASLVRIAYEVEPHDVELRADRDDLYAPDSVNPSYATDSDEGDVDGAMAGAPVTVDAVYTTPMEHNNPMEPHTTVAVWQPEGDVRLLLYASTQSVHGVRTTLAPLFGLEKDQVRVVSPHVGGGFGSKGMPHAHDVLAGLCAKAVPGRAVKLALTRRQMFTLAGHRTPTIQRLRLGADADGRLSAIAHEVVERTSTVKEFAEQTATGTRMMYAAPNRRTSHRLASLDVPVPSWMRAPGECPGFFALECAMDELAVACGLDPIELRARNDPPEDPETGRPWSGRRLVECLREGARRFGWDRRPTAPGTLREGPGGRELVGLGVASATYPYYEMPGSEAAIRYEGEDRWTVRIGAADLGTGTWTTLTQVAADALDAAPEDVTLLIGDSTLPAATVAGGSAGLASWGSTVIGAARAFRDQHGRDPDPGAEARSGMPQNPDRKTYARHSFGAHFAEVRVDADTGEIRVPRMLGVFSAGRIVNPRTARSQFLGGMTMGLSMALHEHAVMDPHTGHVVNDDFADYHIAAHADVCDMDATWLEEEDPHANPMGARGIGEIGIVGSPAAVVNAVFNATGIRVRDLPVTPDKLLTELQ
ncbi:xanthine dehydrogenase family protein molybdopterin-binding subunit [Streptomyces sp. RKND-216]|uniref:xanthine dehydrogenase family protein molybdopterin-binding subunit n=1 Tax=Streptomyces sp. RKND-216 TaxID=2562581 RepID=UPI00109DC10C|nr:xanthine dehydrogenase family protein molybdopterin-binding subunit [Streptomyces sp. RKND-216]THA26006.1 xanthine dehydrogenase family protein molybdopterin-binding subunit [Streptomyces sp. RKND-216]